MIISNMKFLASGKNIAVLIFLLFAGACGDSNDNKRIAQLENNREIITDVNACDYITLEDAKYILGEQVKEPQNIKVSKGTAETASISRCIYEAEASHKAIDLFFRRSPVDDNSSSAIEDVRKNLAEIGEKPKSIGGLGDAAFWSFQQLHVFTGGNDYFIITVKGFSNEIAFEKAKSAAEKVLSLLELDNI